MAKQPKHLEKYVELFHREMSEVDPLQQVVLKGHLIIESALDNIITLIFFHPEHIFKGRFAFVQKVDMARAYGLRKNKNSMWNLILSVNEVRNEVAHNLAGEKRVKKLAQLRRMVLDEAADGMRKEIEKKGLKLEDAPDETIVAFACSLCTGFLGTYEHDIRSLRNIIDAFDLGMNPERERVPVKSPEKSM